MPLLRQLILYGLAIAHVGLGKHPLRLIDLKKSPLARCLDGSPASFYWKAASRQNASKWVLHFQGGGECVEREDCLRKAKDHHGSSKYNPRSVAEPTMSGESALLINSKEAENPDFYSWNLVFMNYCSQDNWSGQRVSADNTTHGLYFSGFHIVVAILDALDELPDSLKDATDIVVTGESAGGFGVYANVNHINRRFPKAQVVAAPFSGLYSYAYDYNGPGTKGSSFVDYSKSAWLANIAFWQTRIDPTCWTWHYDEPGACVCNCGGSEPFGWKVLEVPLFVIMSTTDQIELNAHDRFPIYNPKSGTSWADSAWQFLKSFHANQSRCLHDAPSGTLGGRVGYFRPACWIHTGFTDKIKIQGRSYRQAFGDFYFKRGPTPMLVDTCGELCNPTCADLNPPHDPSLLI